MTNTSTQKACERCGKDYSCSAKSQKCWCMDLGPLKEIPKEYKDCLCPDCLQEFKISKPAPLQQDVDYYYEGGNMVFTREYHLKRGYCCNSGCRHCPYKK